MTVAKYGRQKCMFLKICEYGGMYEECRMSLKNNWCSNYRTIYEEINKKPKWWAEQFMKKLIKNQSGGTQKNE